MNRRPATLVFSLFLLLATAGFIALGVWQVERRAWKLDLIETVDTRLKAASIPAPGRTTWPHFSADQAQYTRVQATGHFHHAHEVTVQAVTVLGPGYWVLTPLETPDFTVLVNRGFVPQTSRDPATRASGQTEGDVTITGLLRRPEPGGAFLRANDPAAGRWYSRDVTAIAEAQALGPVAPYFIDADATPNPGGLPVGGLTVVQFRNSHLSYALTWFALAALSAGALTLVLRRRD